MNFLCDYKQPCLDDQNSLGNFSSENADQALFFGVNFKDSVWYGDIDPYFACLGLCASEVSQAEADQCALENAWQCEADRLLRYADDVGNLSDTYLPDDQNPDRIIYPPRPPDLTRVTNDEITVEAVCVHGGRSYTVQAGRVWGYGKADANRKARELGNQLLSMVGCLTEYSDGTCVNTYAGSDFVVPDKVALLLPPYRWDVFGVIPPGLNFTPNQTAMRISGTPTSPGSYSWILTLTDSQGIASWRTYTYRVPEINEPAMLAAADEDQVYSNSISTQYFKTPRAFGLRPGDSLPDGLALNSVTGQITGTPTTPGTFAFHIIVTD